MAKQKKAENHVASTRNHPSAGGVQKAAKASAASAGSDSIVTLNRRAANDRRERSDRRKSDHPVAIERRNLERRVKVNRRRQIDPTTCERDYSVEEIEFMAALDAYKRSSGRMFPTCSEILEVVRGLGYAKQPASLPAPSLAPESLAPELLSPAGGLPSAEPQLAP